MAARARSEAEQLKFLLTIIENAKEIDWDTVATETGQYKAGKYASVSRPQLTVPCLTTQQ